MRVLVLGDTHGMIKSVRHIFAKHGAFDFLLHTGDYYRDGARIAEEYGLDFFAVVGNCDGYDYGLRQPAEAEFVLAGHKILLLHGHEQGVKRSLLALQLYGREKAAEIVVFGHTHQPLAYFEQVPALLNPGSIGYPLFGEPPTYAVLHLGAKPQAEIFTLSDLEQKYVKRK